MTAPQGHWRIVAAGFQGDLNLTADAQGNIHGTIEIDAPNVEQIHGFWDEAERRPAAVRLGCQAEHLTGNEAHRGGGRDRGIVAFHRLAHRRQQPADVTA